VVGPEHAAEGLRLRRALDDHEVTARPGRGARLARFAGGFDLAVRARLAVRRDGRKVGRSQGVRLRRRLLRPLACLLRYCHLSSAMCSSAERPAEAETMSASRLQFPTSCQPISAGTTATFLARSAIP